MAGFMFYVWFGTIIVLGGSTYQLASKSSNEYAMVICIICIILNVTSFVYFLDRSIESKQSRGN